MEHNGNFGQATSFDDLQAGFSQFLFMINGNVESNAEIKRGMLLAKTGDTFKAAAAADTNKPLGIAAADFIADDDNTVAQIYTGGCFHKNKIIADDGVLDALQLELRRQNFILINQQEIFDQNKLI